MADGVFRRFKAECLRNALENSLAGSSDVRAYAFDDADHTVDFDNDEFLTDIAGAALVHGPETMTSVTVSDTGVVDCADFSFTGVTGDPVEAILFTFLRAGDELLMCYVDTGADFTPDGNNVNVTINASGIMQL